MIKSYRSLKNLLVAGVIGIAGCGGGGSDLQETVARVEVTPSAVLLDGTGRTQKLAVRAFDSLGREVGAPAIEFTSSEPVSIKVSGDGTVTAATAVGSAVISVRAGGVAAPPVFATVAETYPNTILVSDEQVVEGPRDISSGAIRRYAVVIRSATVPVLDTIVLASGSYPIAGKVVASTVRADGSMELALELAPLGQLFRTVSFKGSFSAAELKIALKQATATAPTKRSLATSPAFQARFGPFECEADYDLAAVKIEVKPSVEQDLGFVWDLGAEQGNDKESLIEVRGIVEAKFDGSVTLGAAAGKFECSAPLLTIPVPITGPLAAIFSPTIPVGVKMSIESELSTNASVAFSGGLKGTIVGGYRCDASGSCAWIREGKSEGELRMQPAFANTSARAKLGAFGGASVGVSIGNVFGSLPAALEADVGLEHSSTWGSVYDAAADVIFDPKYMLSGKLAVGAGPGLQQAMKLLRKKYLFDIDAALTASVVLGRSPFLKRASLSQNVFKVGDSMVFRVALDAASVHYLPPPGLGAYNVREIRIYRMDYLAGTALQVAAATAANGQYEFEVPWTAIAEGTATSDNGKPTFFAFLVPQIDDLLRNEFPIELGGVDGPSIQVVPGQAVVLAGSTSQFVAQINGSPASAGVQWSASGGNVNQDGVFAAGMTPGAFEVRATRIATGEIAIVPMTVQAAAAAGFTISGYIRDEIGAGVPGANIDLTVNAVTYTARSDGLGFYSLRLSDAQASGLPTGFVVNASEPISHHPSSMILLLSQGRFIRNDFILRSFVGSPQLLSIELVPEVHHLGNGNFSGVANSQFQFPRAEGASFVKAFSVTETQRGYQSARLILRVKGLECSNEVRINNLMLGSLISSDRNGGFTVYELPLDVTWLNQGPQNTFVFSSGSCFGDLDDFEFANVQIQFQ